MEVDSNISEDILELHIIFGGRVQGVGFRASTHSIAFELGLKGTVCNLPNGTVEIYAQGYVEDLKQLTLQLQNLFRNSTITSSNFSEPKTPFKDFLIRYH